jgi:transposase
VLIDESGFFLNPLVRRTWAPKGRRPVLIGFGRHRDKVSTIAAISIAPRRRRLGLYWRTDPEHYIDAAAVVGFLRELLRHLRGEVIVVWDGGSNHKGPLIREFLRRYPRLHLERLPGYAPDLNPVEQVWSHLKSGRMANFVPRHVRHLDQVVRGHLADLAGKPSLIQALWAGSKLPFPDKNPIT